MVAALVAVAAIVESFARQDPRLPALTLFVPALYRNGAALFANSWETAWGAAGGLVIGALVGLVVGIAAGSALAVRSRVVNLLGAALFLALVALETLPLVALAPAISSSMDVEGARILLAATGSVFPVAGVVTAATRGGPRLEAEILAQLHRGPAWRAWALFNARPTFDALLRGLQIAVPAALLGSLVAEFFGADHGLGVFVLNSLAQNRFSAVWAGCVWLMVLAIVPVAAIGLLVRRGRWSTTSPSMWLSRHKCGSSWANLSALVR
jgi:sulfonate transport system permease protein